jgi:hypothetical protein
MGLFPLLAFVGIDTLITGFISELHFAVRAYGMFCLRDKGNGRQYKLQ